ncbi:MAG TPA: acetyl-CoA carboxylase biotin carboxyl carrier protein [Bryobacteraceae bacterium]|nr:acetyl-CoA carboxylase biotin carboxyl carrier protein [Bryobacteraceae bacterium]
MTIDEIKELLRVFNDSGVGELEIERAGERLRLRRAPSEGAVLAVAPAPLAPISLPAAPAPAPAPQALAPERPPEPAEQQVFVKSPIVGTFYESSKPDAPPFVQVGDAVEPGQILCIIESMKLMNEIPAEIAGTVVAKLAENGKPVEYGQPLFAIQPR